MKNKGIIIGVGVLVVGVLSFFLIKQFGKKKSESVTPLPSPSSSPQKDVEPDLVRDVKSETSTTTTTPTTTTTQTSTTTPTKTSTTSTTTTSTKLPSIVTSKNGTRVRRESSTNSSILKVLETGVKMSVVGSEQKSDGLWYKVVVSPKLSGFVRSDVVNI